MTRSVAESQALGARLAAPLRAGDVLLLHGDLGAGKTTLVQGIIGALRPGAPVSSPTFTLVNEYGPVVPGEPTVYHLDLYRLAGAADLDSIGFDDLITSGDGIVLVEWPERLGDDLPGDYLLISIEPDGPDQRVIALRPFPPDGSHARIPAGLTDAPVTGGLANQAGSTSNVT